MDNTEKRNGGNSYSQGEWASRSLIPGLPDEIATECLIRVPYQFHSNLKFVCRNWRSLLHNPLFYQERRKSGAAERLVCLIQPLAITPPPEEILRVGDKKEEEEEDWGNGSLLQGQYGLCIYNATRDSWHRTRPKIGRIPMFCQCLALGSTGKLMVLGGWDPCTLEPVPDVYILDLVSGGGSWRRAAPMSVARSFFACAVAGGGAKVYVAGGHDDQKNALKSAEVYYVEDNRWEKLPDLVEERDECQGLSWEGDSRFCVISGYGTQNQGEFRPDAECFDPEIGAWTKIGGVWPFSRTSPRGCTAAVSSGGKQHWWWFSGNEQENFLPKSWKTTSSIKLPKGILGTSPCVSSFANGGGDDGGHRVFVMSGGGGCEGKIGFIMERDGSGNIRWNRVHTPMEFSSFPFSASSLLV